MSVTQIYNATPSIFFTAYENDVGNIGLSGSALGLPDGTPVNFLFTDAFGNSKSVTAVVTGGEFRQDNVWAGMFGEGLVNIVAMAGGASQSGSVSLSGNHLQPPVNLTQYVLDANQMVDLQGVAPALEPGSILTIVIRDVYDITVTATAQVQQDGSFSVQNIDTQGLSEGLLSFDIVAQDANGPLSLTNIASLLLTGGGPQGTDNTLNATEDTPFVLSAAAFGYSSTQGNTLTGVKISGLPAKGTLKLNGVAVTVDDVITKADLDAGKLTYQGALNGNGSNYASLQFKVMDSRTGNNEDTTPNTLTFNVATVNDAAIISGTVTGAVIEAGGVANAIVGTPTATGTLTSTDVDGTANAFTAVTAGTASTGGYGTYAMTAGGVWTYTLNNDHTTVQALKPAQTLTDTFTVKAADGTPKVVTVTINGTNDAAVISGPGTATLTESNAVQATMGTLTSTDVDGTNNLFIAQTNVAGSNGYGKFSITTGGAWTYAMNSAQDQFVAGTVYTDSITVAAADGTTKVVTVTITGTNDAPVLADTVLSMSPVLQGAGVVPTGAMGVLVSSLVGGVSDVDTGAAKGIAITAVNTSKGALYYSLNGGTNWSQLTDASESTARLLKSDANHRVYFQAAAGTTGDVADALTFRAWDQSTGTDGQIANVTASGGSTAFSTATDTVSEYVVTPVTINVVSGDNLVAKGEAIPLTGKADPNATVKLNINGAIREVTANATGDWAYSASPVAEVQQVRFIMVRKNLLNANLWDQNGYFGLSELTVNQGSTNLASGKTVTTSLAGVAGSTTTLTDGTLGTIVDVAAYGEHWVQIDLGANYAVDSIKVGAVQGGNAYGYSNSLGLNGATIYTSLTSMSGMTTAQLNAAATGATPTVSSKVVNGVQNNGTFVDNKDLFMEGSNTITASELVQGVSSQASLVVSMDRIAPVTTVTSAALSADTGTSSTDFVTSVAAQTITGNLSANLAAGEKVMVSLDNGVTWTAATASVGTSTWSLPGVTLSGTNTLQAKVVDTAGNGSTPYAKVYAFVPVSDLTVGVTRIEDNAGTPSTVLSGGTSNDTTPTLVGTLGGATQGASLAANEVVVIYRTPNLAAATVVQAGTLAGGQIASGKALTFYNNGDNNYTGNVYLPTAPADGDMVVINKTAAWGINVYAGSTQLANVGAPGSPSGGQDNLYFKWNAASGQWLMGTNALVKLGTATVTTNAAGQSTWTYNDTATLGNSDSVNYIAQVENTAGTFGQQSTPNALDWKYTVDNLAPASITLIGMDDVAPVTGPISANSVTNDATPTFSGNTEANAVVSVYDGATLLGTTTASATGDWSFTPTTAMAPGAHNVTAKATDAYGNTSASSTALPFTIDTVAPQAVADTNTGTEDVASLSGTVATNDTSKDGSETYALVGSATGAKGTLVLNANGSYTYTRTSSADEITTNLVETFTYKVTDAAGNTTQSTLKITLTPVNDAAVIAGTSTASLTESNAVQATIGTLTSTDVDGTNNLFIAQTNVAGSNGYGKFSITTGGAWTYTMNSAQDQFVAGTAYTDSITVAAADGTTKVVTVTINGTNDAAVIAGSNTATLTESNAVQATMGTLTSTDVDGTNNLFTEQTNVAGTNGYGKFSITTGGVWTYTMNTAQNQFVAGTAYTDSITVAAADGTTKVVTVTINGTNDAAVISGSSNATLTESNAVQATMGTLSSTDVDGTNNLFIAQTNVSGTNGYGKFSITTGGVWTYAMNSAQDQFVAGTAYTDSITVAAADGTTKVVTVTINGTNDAPVVQAAIPDQMALRNTLFSYTLPEGTFFDPDGALTYTATRGDGTALPAWLTFDAGTLTFSGTPTATTDFNIKVTASDGSASISDTFLLGLAPVATSVAISGVTGIQNNLLNAGDTVTATVNFSEMVNVTGAPQLTLNIGGILVKANYVSGSGTNALAFSYTILDGQTDANGISINANSLGLNGGTITDAVGNNGVQDFSALIDNISYKVDTTAATAVADIKDSTEDTTPITGNVATNDTGKDTSETYAIVGSATGTYGTLVMNANGTYSYARSVVLDHIQTTAVDTFTYKVTDAAGNTTQSTLTINMAPVNDAAVIGGDLVKSFNETNTALTVTGALTITDVDSAATFNALTGVVGTYGSFSMTTAGAWTYVMSSAQDQFKAGTAYNDVFTVTSADGTSQTVTVTINGTNDAPVNTLPGSFTLDAASAVGVALTGLSVADVDSLSNITVTLAMSGAGSLSATTGNAALTGSGTSTLKLTGTLSQVNATLATVKYTAAVNGTATLTMTTSDGTATDVDSSVISAFGLPLTTTGIGYVVSSAGDVNGDGFDDVIVGAPTMYYEPSPGTANSGGAYVIYGNATGALPNLAKDAFNNINASIDASAGFKISTGLANLKLGRAVSGIGDINGDGFDDVLVSDASTTQGHAYVVYGKATNTGVAINASGNITSSQGFRISETFSDGTAPFGSSVTGLGDVNGDGFTDFAVQETSTTSLVIYGGQANQSDLALASNTAAIAATRGYRMYGAVSAVGDMNNDGIADVVSTSYNQPDFSVKVYFSNADGTPNTTNVAYKFAGTLSNSPVNQVTSMGDVNGDGLADLAILSDRRAYVVYANSSNTNVALDTLTAAQGFKVDLPTGSSSYQWISSAGDVNGDGLADLVMGKQNSAVNYAIVVYGKATGTNVTLTRDSSSTNVNEDAIAASDGFKISSAVGGEIGHRVSNAGDFNGDGLADLILGGKPTEDGLFGVVLGGTQYVTGAVKGIGNVTGTSASQALFGSVGADTLTGGGGVDRFFGGDGNDTIVLTASDVTNLATNGTSTTMQLSTLDGGGDYDTLRLTGGASLNLTTIRNQGGTGLEENSRIESMERIDLLTDTAANTLTLNASDVNDMAGMNLIHLGASAGGNTWASGSYTLAATVNMHQLVVDGIYTDKLVLAAGLGDWVFMGTMTNTTAGRVYGVYQNTTTNSQVFAQDGLSVTNTDPGTVSPVPTMVSGSEPSALGWSVSSAGDVNADGIADFIVGAPQETSTNGANSGAAYVVYGNTAGIFPSLNSGTIASAAGFKISSLDPSNFIGNDVTGIGDINGDGMDDVLVGGDRAGGAIAAAYVVYGNATGTGASIAYNAAGPGDLTAAAGGFKILGSSLGSFGISVSGVGDVNGDGFSDFIVSNPGNKSAFVVYGGTQNGATLDLSGGTIASNRGYEITTLGTNAVNTVSGAGDVNGDGLADIIVADYADSTATLAADRVGRAVVIYSNPAGTVPANLNTISATQGFKITGGGAGGMNFSEVSSLGDVNGDGLADVGVISNGRLNVVFGNATGTAVNLTNFTATQGFTFETSPTSILSSVSSAGDINGDGLNDIIVGDSAGVKNMQAFVIYGRTASGAIVTTGYDLDNMAASDGFKIKSSDTTSQFGFDVSNAGDVNGDGLADLIVGAPQTNSFAGAYSIILGGSQYISNALKGTGTVTGTSAPEVMVGSTNADTLTGGGGVDRFFAGEGRDTIVLTSNDVTNLESNTFTTGLSTVHGGGDFDTLRLSGGASLDLTAIRNQGGMGIEENSRIESIERIDLAADTESNTLTLMAKDVNDMAGFNLIRTGSASADGKTWTNVSGTALSASTPFHQLVVEGTGNDVVNISSETGWTNAGIVNNGTSNYTVWQNQSTESQILVQSGTAVIAPVGLALASDTGTSATDFITNNGAMTVQLSVPTDAWSYSTDSGATWTTGTGTSFVLGAGTYASNAVQVRENTMAGLAVTNYANALTIDKTAPVVTVTMSDSALTLGEKSTVTFQFSENVANFDINDVAIQNSLGGVSAGGLSAWTQVSDSKWTAVYTPAIETNTTSNRIVVGLNSYIDVAGNNGGAGQFSFNVDTRFSSSLTAGFYGTTSSSSSSNGSVTTNAVIVDYWNPAWQGDTITTYKNGSQIDVFTVSGATDSKSLGNLAASPGDVFYSTVTHNGTTYNLFNMIKVNPGTAGLTRYDSPLVLDLNGDGVQTLDISHGTVFDLRASGTAQKTGWVDANDGLLCLDLNHDGKITSGAELFGSSTLLADGQKAADGWSALAQYDANSDGSMDAEDAAFNLLKVWQDANGNGVTDAGELRSLKDVGVIRIDLSHDNTMAHQNGNLLQGVSSYTNTDGKTHEVVDVWFQTVSEGAIQTTDLSASDDNAVLIGLQDVLACNTLARLPVTDTAADSTQVAAGAWTNSGLVVHDNTQSSAVLNATEGVTAQLMWDERAVCHVL